MIDLGPARARLRELRDMAVRAGDAERVSDANLVLEDLERLVLENGRLRDLARANPPNVPGLDRGDLTARQREVMDWLRAWLRRYGVWPTHRTIMRSFGWKSTNAVTSLLHVLEARGYLERTNPPGQSAAWRLTGR